MNSLDEYMKNGYECMSHNNVAQAIEYFQAALQYDPNNEEAKMCLYLAYNRQGKPQYAKKYHDAEIPTNGVPLLDASYIKWHKEQVIEKWSEIMSSGIYATGYPSCCNDELLNETDMISCHLMLFPVKLKTTTQIDSDFYYIFHPLYSKGINGDLPGLVGYSQIHLTKKDLSTLEQIIHDACELPPYKYDCEILAIDKKHKGQPRTELIKPEVTQLIHNNNQLERLEYEYFNLYLNYHLGLRQFEQWHPNSSIKECVGQKHLIMGIDEEMHNILFDLIGREKNKGAFVTNDLGVIPTPYFLKKPFSKKIVVDEFVLNPMEIISSQLKKGYYGDYFVGVLRYLNDRDVPNYFVFLGLNEELPEVGCDMEVLFIEERYGLCIFY